LANPSRQLRASAVLAAWFSCTLALPLLHAARHAHADAHTHGPVDAASLDPSTFLDASGAPDLKALARALEGHDEPGDTHAHDDEPLHGLGAQEHFGTLLTGPGTALAAPLEGPVDHGTVRLLASVLAPPARADFLTTQRAQAPPA